MNRSGSIHDSISSHGQSSRGRERRAAPCTQSTPSGTVASSYKRAPDRAPVGIQTRREPSAGVLAYTYSICGHILGAQCSLCLIVVLRYRAHTNWLHSPKAGQARPFAGIRRPVLQTARASYITFSTTTLPSAASCGRRRTSHLAGCPPATLSRLRAHHLGLHKLIYKTSRVVFTAPSRPEQHHRFMRLLLIYHHHG
ncbi:hypothetical protein BD414DRAFT_300478 [Trametes punicea]|nr:hypothetical protein BD414DRAFT_300478 [Trametes punicea]